MPIKVTLGLVPSLTGDRRFSWTESYWLPNASGFASTVDATCANLALARLGLCASNVQLLSIRQSLFQLDSTFGQLYATRQRNRIQVPAAQVTGTILNGVVTDVNPVGTMAGYCDQAKACVQVALDGQVTGGGPVSADTKYVAGIPDALIQTGPGGTLIFSAVPGWNDRFAQYMEALQAGGFAFYGIRNPPSPLPKNIISWVNEAAAPNRLILTVGSQLQANATPLVAGNKVHVRGIRNNVSRTPRAVGIWRVAAVAGPDASGNYSYTLANSSGFTASDILTPGTAESVTNVYFTYIGTGTPLRATAHKRGATYGASRGRSRARPRQLA